MGPLTLTPLKLEEARENGNRDFQYKGGRNQDNKNKRQSREVTEEKC